MINFDIGAARFNYRVAAVCLHQDHVLTVKPDNEDFWFLPGGRVEMLEDSATALRRELREELGVEAEIGRLLWLVENFFGGRESAYHELCLYYLVPLAGFPALCQVERPFLCRDEPHLCFQWQPLATLNTLNLLPSFLPERLRR
ncbi:MAG TPA: NUDIX hydrolase, partial [Ktedonobacterales bacterium]